MWGRPFFCSIIITLCVINTPLYPWSINRLNGGGTVVYIDFSIPGAIPLELIRSYHSITAVNESNGWLGAFGWGWTSPFETTLTTTPERLVLLRDGSSGNTVVFRPEKEDPKLKEAFLNRVKKAYLEETLRRKLSESELNKMSLPEKMLTRLKVDSNYRLELAGRYKLEGPIPRGEVLVSSEYGYQTMQFKNNSWVREKDGITQIFDGEGKLKRQVDKNGESFDFRYSSGPRPQLTEISAADRSMSLKLAWRQDRVAEVVDNRGARARYTYDNGANLISVTDSNNQTYVYKYENKRSPHLLTKIEYPTESTSVLKVFREIQYDENGMIRFHRDKDGTELSYTYGKSTTDPETNFWTKVVRKKGGVTEEVFDEYFIKTRPDGSKYLYKQDSRNNGLTTTTLFTMCCGKPQQIIRSGEITRFKYSADGLLLEKVGPKIDIRIEYDPRWKKVTRVEQDGLVSKYEYDNRGNLVSASNGKNQRVLLKYDKVGRILEMSDKEGKFLSFKYNSQGKPTLISQKGVGTVRIEYDIEGKVLRTQTVMGVSKGSRMPTDAVSQEIIQKVMKSFQILLDVLRPASVANLTTT